MKKLRRNKIRITNVEFLEDKVRVHYHLGKPWGIPDVFDFREVDYNKIRELQSPPKEVGLGYEWCKEIFVPKVGRTIIFVFDSYPEKSMGPNEEDIYGPYLKEK